MDWTLKKCLLLNQFVYYTISNLIDNMIKHKYWSVFLILITVLPVLQAKAEVDHENLRYLSGIYHESWAVIIGINEYENMKDLKYAVNDAVEVKDMFIRKYGFKNDQVQ